MGSPSFPAVDHKFGVLGRNTVEPNLMLLPHLPSYIISPSYGKRDFTSNFSLNVLPNLISVEPSVTLRMLPPSTC